MISIEKPDIEFLGSSPTGDYAKFSLSPLNRGYGTTLGNSIYFFAEKMYNRKYEYRRIKNGDKKYQRAKKDRIWKYPTQARRYNNHWIVYRNMRKHKRKAQGISRNKRICC